MRVDEFLFVRVVFSFLLLTLLFLLQGRLRATWREVLYPKFLCQCAITGFFIAMNWLFYIIAVNKNLTTQASIGYFISPLISVMLGVGLFQDKLTRWQIGAVIFGALGVVYQMLVLHMMPWLALMIGCSFALYGALRKKMHLPPVQGMYAELLVMMPIVVFLWGRLALAGKTYDYAADPAMLLMCVLAGVVTLAPLLFFLYAVQHIRLTTIGFAQYSTPTLQFLIAVLYFKEPFDAHRLMTFVLIWIGLGIYSAGLIQQLRSRTR